MEIVNYIVQQYGLSQFQAVALVAFVGVCIVHGALKQLVSSNR